MRVSLYIKNAFVKTFQCQISYSEAMKIYYWIFHAWPVVSTHLSVIYVMELARHGIFHTNNFAQLFWSICFFTTHFAVNASKISWFWITGVFSCRLATDAIRFFADVKWNDICVYVHVYIILIRLSVIIWGIFTSFVYILSK